MRMFASKTAIFAPKYACLVGWWLWFVGCISQDTYLLYIVFELKTKLLFLADSRNKCIRLKASNQQSARCHDL